MSNKATQFKLGQSGNPDGRPKKGYSITEMMKEMLASKPEIKKKIGEQIAKKALQGDVTATKMLWGYMDGQPKEQLDIDNKIQIKIVADTELLEANVKKETD